MTNDNQYNNELLRLFIVCATIPILFKCYELFCIHLERVDTNKTSIDIIDLTGEDTEGEDTEDEEDSYEESDEEDSDKEDEESVEEESDEEESSEEESDEEDGESSEEESDEEESDEEESDEVDNRINNKINNKSYFGTLCNYLFPEKNLFILRGVPGSGKEYMIYHMEKDRTTPFGICDRHEYFYGIDNKYEFHSKEIGQSESHSRRACVKLMASNMPRIYVTDYFEQVWKYQDYINLAIVNGYQIKIIEMRCPDMEHLKYFNGRNPLKPPMSKSKNGYEKWEVDPRAFIQEPWIKTFEGDCLPNTEEYDGETMLTDYYKNGQVKIEPFIQYKENEEHIEFISDAEIETILDRSFIY